MARPLEWDDFVDIVEEVLQAEYDGSQYSVAKRIVVALDDEGALREPEQHN